MIPSTPFDPLQQQWRSIDFEPVKNWKAQHPKGSVIATFPVWVPVEIIHAAGALPVMILGAGGLIDVEYADARMQSFICSISRSTLELGLRGYLKFLDGFVFPSICDVARNLSGVWQRNFPEQMVVYLHLPENIQSPHAIRYMVQELKRLARALEERTGRTITDEALRQAIHAYNQVRNRLGILQQIREQEPDRLSTYEFYQLLRAGAMYPVDAYLEILNDAIEKVRTREARPRDRIRVILEGSFCEQPPPELIWAIEEAGCYILDDDFMLGLKYLTRPVPEEGDPWENLAMTYLRHARPSAIRYDGVRERAEGFIRRVKDLGVDGVIFAYAKFCDPAQFDYVVLKTHLERLGIPHLSLEFEEKMTVFETVRNQVETFVESILFYA
ncbi:MAG: benzoyl-CoA reductase subunit C [Lentisphaerae bacterium]|nr:MAG: benzoyl-CoA reductase subunit C [Lentisphaerota bacterium]